ncbi:MAG: Stk1 family PASTA domain-containing Ser/Thr kinase [Carbonactinosporaceae bacterium]
MDATLQDPLVGHVLDGRYRVESRLARGGMATVYQAVDTRLERTVALKVMHTHLADNDDFVARFIQEAKSAARLSHPNVVAVFDQGGDGRQAYLAMEFVRGRTLRDLLRDRRRLTPREAFRIVEPMLAALSAAHRAGIVHRDVKPENVLLADDGRVKVADFGLARAVSATTSTNSAGLLIGTPSYLSPEQVRRGAADARSDVYSAGILLFELLTGEKPFHEANPVDVAARHVHDVVPAPSTRVPGLPAQVDALVVAATSREPRGRPADAGALLAEVHRVREGLTEAQLDARPASGPGGADVGENTLIVPATRETAAASGRRPPHPRRGAIAFVTVFLLALLVSLAAWWLGSGRYVAVPSVLQKTKPQAATILDKAGLAAEFDREYSETVARGRVIETSPGPQKRIVSGETVSVMLSRGPERYPVPELPGLPLGEAKAAIKDSHLVLGQVSEDYSDSVEQGLVISSGPAAGTEVKPRVPVDLVVSKGPPPIEVPNVVGAAPEDAVAALEAAGLTGQVVGEAYSDTVPAGQVASQDPASGQAVAPGATVGLTLSKGPEVVAVPNVVGMPVEQAQATLEGAGFVVRVLPSLPGGDQNVTAQYPPAGSQQPKGATVTLSVY